MKKALLIIDDNEDIINEITEVIGSKFDVVCTATNVDDAQAHIATEKFTLITLDINLHGRHGSEVVKFIMDYPDLGNASAPIILISGYMTPGFIKKNNPRFAGMLTKPFDAADLQKIADDAIGGLLAYNAQVNFDDLDEIPIIKCQMPFTIMDLDEKVAKIISKVKEDANLKKTFAALKIKRDLNSYIANHIGMLINISYGIAMKMGWDSEAILTKIVYAAYLHDAALAGRNELAKINTIEELDKHKKNLSFTDQTLVLEHANLAAHALQDIMDIPDDVVTMVRQHHELPKANGFPAKIAHNAINPLSALFIVAHDFTDYIIDTPKWSLSKYILIARVKFIGVHFNKAVGALESFVIKKS